MTWTIRSSAPSASCRWHKTEGCNSQSRETRLPGEAGPAGQVGPWGPHEVHQVQVQGAASGLEQPPVSLQAEGWTDLLHQSKRQACFIFVKWFLILFKFFLENL